jgi:hypothetical protein
MAKLILNGSTSGSVTLDVPAVAGTTTLTLPATTDTLVGKATTDTLTNKSIVATQLTGTIAAARLPAGSVLQIVNASFATETSSSSSTYADTGLTASITPSSVSNKVLILVNIPVAKGGTDTYAGLRLLNGSTTIITFSVEAGFTATTGQNSFSMGTNYLDSPATTSSTTYKVQFNSQTNSSRTYICGSGSRATMTLMEIAG